tara:strand:- start:7162 stop:7401 length:240 start_codon:yes stop_codon:yes gene_type:complete
MSANNILSFGAAVGITAALYIIMDPIITGFINNVSCSIAQCTTSLGYFETFWKYFLVITLILYTVHLVVNSIYEGRQGY